MTLFPVEHKSSKRERILLLTSGMIPRAEFGAGPSEYMSWSRKEEPTDLQATLDAPAPHRVPGMSYNHQKGEGGANIVPSPILCIEILELRSCIHGNSNDSKNELC